MPQEGELLLRTNPWISLLVNSLGGPDDRSRYVAALHDHFSTDIGSLSEDSRATLATNPLRVLDSSRPEDADLIASAPQHAGPPVDRGRRPLRPGQGGTCRSGHPPSRSRPRLVRGLDYYVRTTFEFTSAAFDAAQNAIGGGGRYDGLAEADGSTTHTRRGLRPRRGPNPHGLRRRGAPLLHPTLLSTCSWSTPRAARRPC